MSWVLCKKFLTCYLKLNFTLIGKHLIKTDVEKKLLVAVMSKIKADYKRIAEAF